MRRSRICVEAEGGIRSTSVTEVQTCALPIIDPTARERVFPRQRADVDDVSRAAANHRRHNRFRYQKHALEIGVQYTVPVRLCFFVRRTKQTNSRVIHQDANGTECRFGFRNKLRDLAYICDLGKMKKRTRAELFHVCRGIFQGLAVAAANGHGGSERCQAMRDGAADAAAPSGHQRYTRSEERRVGKEGSSRWVP